MPERLTEMIAVRVGADLDERIERLADSMDYHKPDLVRKLLDHALRNPPDWMGKLADALRVERDTVSA